MKTIFALATFIACNDPKDPPDEGFVKMAQAHADSLARVDSLQLIPNQ